MDNFFSIRAVDAKSFNERWIKEQKTMGDKSDEVFQLVVAEIAELVFGTSSNTAINLNLVYGYLKNEGLYENIRKIIEGEKE